MKKILVYGLGNFGYAILSHLDKNIDYDRFQLYGFDRNQELITNLKINKKHTIHHKDVSISDNIVFFENKELAIKDIDILIISITSKYIIEELDEIKKWIPKNKKIIILNTAKAISENGLTYYQEIKKMNLDINYSYGMFSGGTIAKDLFNSYPLGATIAFEENSILKYIAKIFESNQLYIEKSNDVIGTEYAGSFKNVGSILAGYIKGIGLPYGTETYMLTKFSEEVKNLVVNYLGGNKSTFSMSSQCRGNDFWMSCTGNTRNREFGEKIGEFKNIEKAFDYMQNQNKTVEGIYTLKSLEKIFENKKIEKSDFPIITSCIDFLENNINIPYLEII